MIGRRAVYVYSSFKNLFVSCKENHTSHLHLKPIPHFEEDTLKQLCTDAIAYLRHNPPVLDVSGPAYIIGDINGNIIDLSRIISKCDSFSTRRFIFLGNYIGRGVFSIECLALILSMYCLCPQNIVVLRGSSEFEETSTLYGFDEEIQKEYGNLSLYQCFQEVFSWLPYAAVVSRQVLCIHGGITEQVASLDQVRSLERPFYTMENEIIAAVLNPAPEENVCLSESNTVRKFLHSNGIRKIIRGHDISQNGIISQCDGKVLTVFSNGNFRGAKNKAGFIFLNEENEIRGHAIPICGLAHRDKATFEQANVPEPQEKKGNPRVFRSIMKDPTGVKRHSPAKINAMTGGGRHKAAVLAITRSRSAVKTNETPLTPTMLDSDTASSMDAMLD